jgi:hypothetical protein
MCDITGPFSEEFKQKVKNCSGAVGPGNALVDYWNNNDCFDVYSRVINTTESTDPVGIVLEYNKNGQQEVQNCVVELFDTYLETKQITDSVLSPEFSSFQDTLLTLCITDTLPGVCEKFLNGYCSKVTRTQAANSPALTNFCGCYVPPDPVYLKYTTPPPSGQPACDPLCHRAQTSQKADIDTGTIIKCNQNICVLDNIVIQGNNNNIPGGINFNSLCAGCGSPQPPINTAESGTPSKNGQPASAYQSNENCLCIVSGINVADTLGNVGIGDNLNQFCGSNSVCITTDEQGNVLSEGQCTGQDNITVPKFSDAPSIWLVILIIIIVVIIFFACLAVRYS